MSGTTVFTRTMEDGSQELFKPLTAPWNRLSGVFWMTEARDPQGNPTTLQYDSIGRLAAVTDGLGQQLVFSYTPGATGAYQYRVKEIDDPFGRSASFAYSGSTRLETITDAMGMESNFT